MLQGVQFVDEVGGKITIGSDALRVAVCDLILLLFLPHIQNAQLLTTAAALAALKHAAHAGNCQEVQQLLRSGEITAEAAYEVSKQFGNTHDKNRPPVAFELLRYAAEHNCFAAYNDIGRANEFQGMKSTANDYYKLGADGGDVLCQVTLGVNLLDGFGVAVDKDLAVHYLKLAAAQDHPNAVLILREELAAYVAEMELKQRKESHRGSAAGARPAATGAAAAGGAGGDATVVSAY